MRTTKRFTPKVLRRFEREGRGLGTYGNYIPYHRVSRGDSASSGRSHLLNFKGRLRELLSDGELHAQYFACMLPDLDDSLEQYPLSLGFSAHILAEYGERPFKELFPGTEQLARELGIKHPKTHGDGESAPWRLSTDHVLILRSGGRKRTVLPCAYKTESDATRGRTRDLLSLDREYWVRRGGHWLLITPSTYERSVALTLRRTAPWALGPAAQEEERALAVACTDAMLFQPLTLVLHRLAKTLDSMQRAQNAFWQAVWAGEIPLDLRLGWRPHLPLELVSKEVFRSFNPLASRRSAWTS